MIAKVNGNAAVYPSLKGRVVVVTGGGSGIGAALTEAFARQGARVAFIDVAEEASRALDQSLSGLDPAPAYYHCDITDTAALKAVLARIAREAGPVDVLVNNAANDDRHRVEDVTPEYWDNRIAINLRHQFFASQAVAEGMRARGQGVIVNLGSISWRLGLPELSVYETAKAGVEGMTRAMARELGEHGVRVVCIVPGNVKTPRQAQWYTAGEEARIVEQQALKFRIEPGDIAAVALFLASDDARACTGHEFMVDAGWG
ncbi:SDR family oxidoreductase [Alkalicaulis satelles]|uniref:SDR family oxidoreductase n=1 Tax=Alkalicaulis satelles TaxID=2609175 RepID=A0A5M6ZJR7_9PROT|nr:SDR family oxidoreductase [Alkalicaulis satelles]KAA5805053.1 SDR family oxidoreductase [Alkalicaulis satelles]